MPRSLIFYSDALLTQPIFSLPLGSANENTYTLADMTSYSDADGTYYYTNIDRSRLGTVAMAGGVDMTGKNYGNTYTDGLMTTYIRDTGVLLQFGTWYATTHSRNLTGSSGTISGMRTMCAIGFSVEGVPFIAVGWNYNGAFALTLAISENLLGAKATNKAGGQDTKPGSGADSDGGYGTYDYVSNWVKGSAVPLDPPLPVSDTGYGYHAYLLSASAFSDFGRRLWGVGDAADGMAITSSIWQKWQNYRFSPVAGIISCIRLPAVLTPAPTSEADSAIRIAGTVIPLFGQTIAGCKVINPAPTSHVVLDVPIAETYGSWLDFEGVDITLVLPFIGRVPIDPSACVGGIGRVRVVYQCDAMTGNIAAMIYVWDRWSTDPSSDYQLYTVATGNAAVQVPLVGHADGQVQMLGTLAADALTIGAGAALGNPIAVAGGAISAASSLLLRREQTQTVGTYAGSVSYISSTTAYIIITKPQPTSSPHYDHTHGRPSDFGATIGDYTGYNEFYDVDVELLADCTPEDRQEINRLLQGGVIL